MCLNTPTINSITTLNKMIKEKFNDIVAFIISFFTQV